MTVLTVGVVATVVTAGAAAPLAVGAAEGAAAGLAGAGVAISGAASTGAATAGAAAAAASAGAITGAAAGTGAAGAAAAGATAAAAAGGVTATGAGAAGMTAGVLAGPIGWLVLGTKASHNISFDCWKAVLHESHQQASKGITLREIAQDPRIKAVVETANPGPASVGITLVNIWDEEFHISYVQLHGGELAAHATKSS